MDGVVCPACAVQKKDPAGAEVAAFLRWAKKSPPPKKAEPLFQAATLAGVGRVLQTIIVFHLEREPKSLRLLK